MTDQEAEERQEALDAEKAQKEQLRLQEVSNAPIRQTRALLSEIHILPDPPWQHLTDGNAVKSCVLLNHTIWLDKT